MNAALRVTHRNWIVNWKVWRQGIFFSFLQPMLFLSAMGLGVGTLMGATDPEAFGGFTYLQFIAPGLMASTAMQTGSFETSWPIMGKIAWMRIYDAMLATPLTVKDLVKGELMWIAIRLATISIVFLGVITAFGVPVWPNAVFAVPMAVLTGLAFASVIMSYTATLDDTSGFNGLFRFVITPLFLFSGTFFPIERLPAVVRPIAYVTPLYHGVTPVRGLTLGTMGAGEVLGHAAYLLVMFTIGSCLAYRNLRRRLIK